MEDVSHFLSDTFVLSQQALTGDSRDDGGFHGVLGEVCRVSVAEVFVIVEI